ncbi:hypothetical protein [Aurantiacibacter zhengii]|uniref:Uncharacterized protein n=1 Tax=Aurantiacibacter zhengii TaxID=2307003 RepID=A0A418NQB3_9SPHN|nr:hypothetical protein [Aurantiacibacter zhengii]RIV84672.1 hypothetical protein D2V07_13965 [Aurantiacibacter zhengii]
MSILKPDSDTTEPIHFSEAYRRAKRNVLFWATTTIVVAAGARAERDIEVTGLVNGLAFPPWMMLLGLLLILVFMLTGYIRAEQDLINLNTEEVVRHRIRGVIELVAGLRTTILELRQEAEHERYRTENLFAGSRSAIEKLDTDLQSVFNNERDFVQHNVDMQNAIKNLGDAPPWREVGKITHTFGTRVAVQARQVLDNYRTIHHEFIANAPPSYTREDLDAHFTQLLTPIDELTARLTGLASAISKAHKSWFRWHDRGPVWLAFALAMFLAIVRLSASETLDVWLGIADPPTESPAEE